MRTPVLILTLLAGLVPLALAIYYFTARRHPLPSPAAAATESSTPVAAATTRPQTPTETTPEAAPPAAQTETSPLPRPTPRPAPPPATGPRSLPSADSVQLVAKLTQPDLNSGPMTPEKAAAWKENLQQLVQQGAAGTPAIRDFLEKNLDMNFDPSSAGKLLGQSSLRMAFLDALRQIGGPEAMAISGQTLQTTTDPREIAFLARNLDQQAPEQYRDAALKAARESLALATEGKLEAKDVGPLFDVLRLYGGAGAVPDLEQAASRWKYYSAIALADLPEGAGIPSLIQMAQLTAIGSRANRVAALEALAQLSPLYPEARDALLQQAQASQISDSSWITVAGVLAGDKLQIGKVAAEDVGTVGTNLKMFHLSNGNQDFYSTQTTAQLSAEEVTQRVGLIDQLLGQQKNLSPTATEALQKSRATLANRVKP